MKVESLFMLLGYVLVLCGVIALTKADDISIVALSMTIVLFSYHYWNVSRIYKLERKIEDLRRGVI